MSTTIQIADAVVDALNLQTFSQVFTAVRKWVPSFTVPELSTLRVCVVPKGETIEQATRSEVFVDHTVLVGIQKKINGDAEADQLCNLADEVVDYFVQNDLANARRVLIEHDPIASPEMLDEHRTFLTLIAVTYRSQR